jgi:hypothetical protein
VLVTALPLLVSAFSLALPLVAQLQLQSETLRLVLLPVALPLVTVLSSSVLMLGMQPLLAAETL